MLRRTLAKCGLPPTTVVLGTLASLLVFLSGCGGGGNSFVGPRPAPNPLLTASPSTIAFGSVRVGDKSAKTLTLTNSGTGTLTISGATVSGTGFSLSGLYLPISLSTSQSVTFGVLFGPAGNGAASGNVSIVSGAATVPLTITLSGAGVTYQLTPSPSSLTFGNVAVASKISQTISLTNTGSVSLSVSQASLAGSSFSFSGPNLPASLAAGQSTSLSVTFAPVTPNPASGVLSIASDASASPLTIALSGAGVLYQLTPSSNNLSFGNVGVTSKSTQSISLTNTGTASLTISQASVTGAGFSFNGLSLPLTLAPGQSVSGNVSFAPQTTGSAFGALSFVNNPSAAPLMIGLSGIGVTYQLTASPSAFDFGKVVVTSNSTRTITLRNGGTASVTILLATLAGAGFSLTGLNVPITLAAGESTSGQITFAPAAASSASGSLSIVSDASPSLTVGLSGTGVTYLLTTSPASLSFGDVAVGSNHSQTITLSNTGTESVTISQASVSGPGFGLNGLTLPLTLAAGQSTSANVTLSPATTGSASGTLSITSNASGSPLAVSLSGTGATYQLAVSPSSLNFGDVAVASSSTQTITLTNTGTASLSVSQINFSGAGFSFKGVTVPMTLTAGQSATVSVTFAPQTTGSASGNMSIVSNASNSTVTVSLSGTGVTYQLTLSPSTLVFGNVNISQNAVLPVALTNNGTTNVTVSQVTAGGTGFSVSSPKLPLSLTPEQTTSLTVTFAPVSAGSFTGSLTITSNAPNSPLTGSLSGAGVHWVQLTWTGSAGASGYNVYRSLYGSNACGTSYSRINLSGPIGETSYQDSEVTSGVKYCYVTTAVNDQGQESGYSNEAAVTIP